MQAVGGQGSALATDASSECWTGPAPETSAGLYDTLWHRTLAMTQRSPVGTIDLDEARASENPWQWFVKEASATVTGVTASTVPTPISALVARLTTGASEFPTMPFPAGDEQPKLMWTQWLATATKAMAQLLDGEIYGRLVKLENEASGQCPGSGVSTIDPELYLSVYLTLRNNYRVQTRCTLAASYLRGLVNGVAPGPVTSKGDVHPDDLALLVRPHDVGQVVPPPKPDFNTCKTLMLGDSGFQL